MLFLILLAALPLSGEEEIARGEWNRGGGHQNYRESYNRYENHRFWGRPYYNNYDENRWEENNRDTLLIETEGLYQSAPPAPYNPDVQYTQPGITDNFESIYQSNQE